MTTTVAQAPAPAAPPARARRRARFARFSGPLGVRIGLAIVAAYLLVAVLSWFWTPYDPLALAVGDPYGAPSAAHWLGTDRLGADVLSRLMAATRVNLVVMLFAVATGLAVGTALGTLAGYFGGVTDTVIMRILEVFQAFPTLLLAMLVVQAVGPGTVNLILIMAFVGMPPYLRLVRAEVMSRRSWQFAEAARMVGARPMRVAFGHLLPNSIGPVLAYIAVNAAWVSLLTAALGFLGLGLPPGTPEWGSMVARGQDAIMTGQWWVSFFPGLAIVGIAGACYLLGDGLADFLDPRRSS
ncbi:ABC transporter permease [Pseudonocardia kujensis]|uniref:ABC transporter permease n=1 Tax=Pseudonocardia kujensis TaxID=1128675 RepID=UPI001E5AEACF|nr:ABC transporter permease [Pseudonocardia kujensis]MCE0764548.1 ABC transporter permease [Pseudonocardia kujensis]